MRHGMNVGMSFHSWSSTKQEPTRSTQSLKLKHFSEQVELKMNKSCKKEVYSLIFLLYITTATLFSLLAFLGTFCVVQVNQLYTELNEEMSSFRAKSDQINNEFQILKVPQKAANRRNFREAKPAALPPSISPFSYFHDFSSSFPIWESSSLGVAPMPIDNSYKTSNDERSNQIEISPAKCACESSTNTCPPGPPGPMGPKGESGLDGLRGRDGLPGFDAKDVVCPSKTLKSCYHCPMGEPGQVGIAGKSGVRGRRGQPGVPGRPGQDGAPGNPGEMGPSGPKGDTGKTGAAGRPGNALVQIGVAGPKGQTGLAGKVGAPGMKGRDGMPGLRGLSGSMGIIGVPGFDGAKGQPGGVGLQGRPGANSGYCACPPRNNPPSYTNYPPPPYSLK